MKLSRQHLLLVLLCVMGLATVGDWVLTSMIQKPLDERRARTEALTEAIGERERLLRETRTAGKRIAEWQKQSLPSDPELARSLYRSWLHERVNEVGLTAATVDSGSPANRRGLYASLPFNVRGRGTLDQFTRLLFDFSSAGHLHRVETISLSPAGAGLFDISVGIEALIVGGTKRSNRLSTETATVLASADADDYAVISRQNLFGVGYRDPLAETSVTAITWRNGDPRVWINDAISGRLLRLAVDEELHVTNFRGRVVSANDKEIILESHGRRLIVGIGQTLADARQVPARSSSGDIGARE